MADRTGKPELEDGYARVANELLEAMARTRLSDYESRCAHFLLRKTYGWLNRNGNSKKEDIISLGQWSNGTGIRRTHVPRTLDRMVERNIFQKTIVTRYNKQVIFWSLNKYYSLWEGCLGLPPQLELQLQLTPVEGTLEANVGNYAQVTPVEGQSDTRRGVKVTPVEGPTIDNKDITKDLLPIGIEWTFMKIFKGLPGWDYNQNEDLKWLQEYRVDYPEATLEHFKSCRDRYSGRPAPKEKGAWKNRFRNWLKKEAQFKAEEKRSPARYLSSAGRRRPGEVPTDEEIKQQAKAKGVLL